MAWIILHVASDRERNASLEQALLEQGALSVTLQDAEDQPVYEPGVGETPLWPAIQLSGLFDAAADIESIIRQLTTQDCRINRADCRVEILEDKDWVRSWMDDYQPIRVGSRLWICPSWQSPPDDDAVKLQLDPGMAFGTGTHPTTALCLEWLEAQPLGGRSLIDFGCGSGILGIAALLLGASSALGVDIDPQALTTARENAARNGLGEHQLQLCMAAELGHPTPTDIVLANILAGPLIALAPRLSALLKTGGELVLSGVLQKQVPEIIGHYPGIRFTPMQVRDEWALLHGVRVGR